MAAGERAFALGHCRASLAGWPISDASQCGLPYIASRFRKPSVCLPKHSSSHWHVNFSLVLVHEPTLFTRVWQLCAPHPLGATSESLCITYHWVTLPYLKSQLVTLETNLPTNKLTNTQTNKKPVFTSIISE